MLRAHTSRAPSRHAEGGVEDLGVGLEVDRQHRRRQVAGGDGVEAGGDGVHLPQHAAAGELRQADADGVAVRLGREAAHGDDAHAAVGHPRVRVHARLAPDDVRVEAGAADVLADAVEQQQVDVAERQARHPATGVVEQRGLVVEPALGSEHGDPGGEVVAALDDGDAAQELRGLDGRGGGVVEERLPPVLDDGPVAGVGAVGLAQPEQQHLHEAALVATGEHRVGLDPVAHDDVVGGGGERVLQDRDAER